MKEKNLGYGLNLMQKEDGFWLQFDKYTLINIEQLGGEIIRKNLREWAIKIINNEKAMKNTIAPIHGEKIIRFYDKSRKPVITAVAIPNDKSYSIGLALKSSRDEYDRKMGLNIARGRALRAAETNEMFWYPKVDSRGKLNRWLTESISTLHEMVDANMIPNKACNIDLEI